LYVESPHTRQALRARRAAKLLEFARREDGRRVVPHLVLDPVPPEEAGWVRRYLELADHALDNHDLVNPAERPGTSEVARDGLKVRGGIGTGAPLRRRA